MNKEKECIHIWELIEPGKYPGSPEMDGKDECQECGKVRKHRHNWIKFCEACNEGWPF